MTMRTCISLLCSCGHRGAIVESENDQPFSKEWSSTRLQNLESKGSYDGPHHLFSKMRPSCPRCGKTLSPADIVP